MTETSMPHGGKRAGAGRPVGSMNRRTRERLALAGKAVASGITPLEVMLEAMHAHHKAGRLNEAAAIARDAAPYMHPRLSQVDSTVKADVTQRTISGEPLPDDEWERTHGGNSHLAATGQG
jgi:hypothetical protein